VEVSRIDPERLVFVDEMGTHTSLAPLYAYAPVGERVFFEIPRNLKARTRRFLRAFIEEGWDHRWPWKGRPQLGSSRPT
jgi:hypothetical protein